MRYQQLYIQFVIVMMYLALIKILNKYKETFQVIFHKLQKVVIQIAK